MDLISYVQQCFIKPIICLVLPQFGILVHVRHTCILGITFTTVFRTVATTIQAMTYIIYQQKQRQNSIYETINLLLHFRPN